MATRRRRRAAAFLLLALAYSRRLERELARQMARVLLAYLEKLAAEPEQYRPVLAMSILPPVREALRSLARRIAAALTRRGYENTMKELVRLDARVSRRRPDDDTLREMLREVDVLVQKHIDPLPRRVLRYPERLRSRKQTRRWADSLARTLARAVATYAERAGEVAANQENGTGYWMWKSVGDERVRPSHRRTSGEVRPIGAPFSNGCRYPRDPLAPIHETINCRCRLLPVLAP